MTAGKVSAIRQGITFLLVAGFVSISTTTHADIIVGYNMDGSPKYGPEPQGATGPIATPENPTWIKNPDGTPTKAELEYTFIPNAEENAKKEPVVISTAPPGMIQIGFNTDGSPKYGPEPQGATGPIATPENPTWIKNPDGTPTKAELEYTFIPGAEQRAREALQAQGATPDSDELQAIVEKEISSSKFVKSKRGNNFTLTSTVEVSSSTANIKVVAVKKGSANKKVTFTFTDDGQLVLTASQKLKGYQLQIISDEKILKKIKL